MKSTHYGETCDVGLSGELGVSSRHGEADCALQQKHRDHLTFRTDAIDEERSSHATGNVEEVDDDL